MRSVGQFRSSSSETRFGSTGQSNTTTGELTIAVRNRKSRNRVRVPKPAAAQNVKEAPLEVIGRIKQVFPSATFSVELDNGHVVLGHIAGRLRRNRIRILPGDRVDMELSPYDLTKGRIVYRYRAGE
jgi:translation initiation factor IF-1